MKETLFILILLLTSTICFSQVGIGTVEPQQELHVSGPTSTIRIESLNKINNPPSYFNSSKPEPAFVDVNGDITLGNRSDSNTLKPLNFIIDLPNFIPDSPPYLYRNNAGTVVNNSTPLASIAVDTITTVRISVPQDAIIEIKYGITTIISGSNLKIKVPEHIEVDRTIAMQTYIKVDLKSNGLTGDELTKIYGRAALSYVTKNDGIYGYSYMNGQAYLTVPAGTHTLYFYGQVSQGGRTLNSTKITSVGFGGTDVNFELQDYLKIRVYN